MKTRLLLLAIGAICLSACSSGGEDDDNIPSGLDLPAISIDGNRFVDASGETVIFRGLAFSDPDRLASGNRWAPAHFDAAAAWGANIVRFPVHPDAWRNRGEGGYFALLDQGIGWAAQRGMYVIIDWHSIGNLKTARFQSSNYNTTMTETRAFWDAISRRYAGRSEVVLYELFNEPTSDGGTLGALTWADQRAISEELIDVVRANDPEALFLVGGLDWAYLLNQVVDDPVAREGVAYVTHPYPQKRPAPWTAQWQVDWGFVAATYPLFATEFGFMSEDGPGAHIPVIGDEVYGETLIDFFEARGISWTPWVFDPVWSPQLIADWEYTPTRQGTFFRAKMLELSGAP